MRAHDQVGVLVGRHVPQRVPQLLRVSEQFASDLGTYIGRLREDHDIDDEDADNHIAQHCALIDRLVLRRVAAARRDSHKAVSTKRLQKAVAKTSRKRSRKQLRSRNKWIDEQLADEDGNDTFADLEDWIVDNSDDD